MPTPIPFNAPRQFTPNISSRGEVDRQVARMKALGIRPTAPAAPVPGPTQPMGSMGRIGNILTGGGVLGTALTFGPVIGQAAVGLGQYLRTPQGEQLKENFGNPIRFLQQQYQNMVSPPVRLEQVQPTTVPGMTLEEAAYSVFGKEAQAPADTRASAIAPDQQALTDSVLQSRAPVFVTTPQSPGQAIGNMAGTDLYNVARQAAAQQGTQQDLDAVTNLGLAQWRANFPGLAGSPLSPEALQRDVQQEELAIKSQDFMEKYRKLMEANRK